MASQPVPDAEFTRNFGRYRMEEQRRSFATADLSGEQVKAILDSRMGSRHDHLDALLDPA